MYLLVKDQEQIKIVNWGNKKMTERGAERVMRGQLEGTELIDYKDSLPDFPIECLFWTSEGGGGIVVKSELIPIDWDLLVERLRDWPVRMKMQAGQTYLQMVRASTEKHVDYFAQAFLMLEKIDPEDMVGIVSDLEDANIPEVVYMVEPF